VYRLMTFGEGAEDLSVGFFISPKIKFLLLMSLEANLRRSDRRSFSSRVFLKTLAQNLAPFLVPIATPMFAKDAKVRLFGLCLLKKTFMSCAAGTISSTFSLPSNFWKIRPINTCCKGFLMWLCLALIVGRALKELFFYIILKKIFLSMFG
jgi:hypothetical protein